MQDYEILTLPNHIRILHKQVPHTQIAHCGFILNIGSRDEQPHQQGLAHFWEHTAFKGTQKRKAYHILSRLEDVGGELNAYTTKEKICFYASLLAPHFEKAVDLLTDITFFSTFPEKELAKERNVILEEMSMYQDDPADAIQDEFDALMFKDHSLGYNILGTMESVQSFDKASLQQFIHENLNTSQLVFSVVSPLPTKKVFAWAEKYLQDIPIYTGTTQRKNITTYEAQQVQQLKAISQAHCMIGTVAYSLHHPKRLALVLLNNILGGNSMNSRLNMTLREKHGLVYAIESNYHPFTDTGQLSIYFGTEKNTMEKSIDLVIKELAHLRNKKLGAMQLHKAKGQLMGQLAMGEESNLSLMLMFGKSLLDLDNIESLPHVFKEIESLSAETLCEVANEVLAEDQLTVLSYLPQ